MTHRVHTRTIVVAPDAIERLAAYAGDEAWRDALLVVDPNTEAAAGKRVGEELCAAGVTPDRLCFPQHTGLAATEDEVERIRSRLRSDRPDGLLAVGSGVITDLTRYAAQLEDRDFVSVPTAASMDGYASSVAALQRDGLKVTLPARAPAAIFADPEVLAAAPGELTRSGVGDLLAKASALTDWQAAHLLYGEPFCERVAARVVEPLTFVAGNVASILSHEPHAIRQLTTGLVQSGVAMAMVGSSRPASGCEHHASHFWDLLAARGERPHAPHGIQVGYATHFAMRLQRFAYADDVQALKQPRAHDPLDADARAWLGDRSPDLLAAIDEKRRFVTARSTSWPDERRWSAVRAGLAPSLERFADVEQALTAAAIPAEPGFLGLDARTLRATFRYASRLRARYTVIDFLEGQDALGEALDAALGAATSANGRADG